MVARVEQEEFDRHASRGGLGTRGEVDFREFGWRGNIGFWPFTVFPVKMLHRKGRDMDDIAVGAGVGIFTIALVYAATDSTLAAIILGGGLGMFAWWFLTSWSA